jgi:2-(1,2-epoxy-1,2-dihydrophenyl)acetyl-CoA isomerase
MVLICDVNDGIATLTLNRPQSLNALNLELIVALREATARVERDDAVRVVGARKAAEIALLGDRFDAPTAERLGLINRVVAAAELDAATDALARRLARGPRTALARTKALLGGALQASLPEQLAAEQAAFAECAALADFDEGLAAFFDKREATFL